MHTVIAALSLSAVLGNAAAYVNEFERRLAAIVAEERYRQDWTALPRGRDELASNKARHVDLVSRLLLVKLSTPDQWMQFRDVLEVDGEPVRDRDERVAKLFERRTITSDAQIRALIDASTRYNVGDVVRTVNTPLFALKFLEKANQSRFKFKLVTNRVPATVERAPELPGAFRTSTEIWVVEYDEKARPTIIRDRESGGRDVPTHGRFWIEPESGRVLMSEVIAENRTVRGTIDVSYQSEPLMGLLVPVEMREAYEGKPTGSRVETVATYGKFRLLEE
jgi:hypothetical protein